MSDIDFIFKKYKENYMITVFYEPMSAYHGFGNTISEALVDIFQKTGKDIPDIKNFVRFLDEKKIKDKLSSLKDSANRENLKKKRKELLKSFPYFDKITKHIIDIIGLEPEDVMISRRNEFKNIRLIIFKAMHDCGISYKKISAMFKKNEKDIKWEVEGINSYDKEKSKTLAKDIKFILEKAMMNEK